MNRRTGNLALAAVIGLIALSLLSGAAAGDSGGSTGAPGASGAPQALTHQFPLGTQTLSRTNTKGGSATTSHRATARSGGSAATPRRQRLQAARRHDPNGVSSVLFLLAIPVLVAVALLSRVAIQKSRRTARRGSRGPFRWPRSAGARWAYVDKDEVDRTAPPLRVRQRDG